jgi:nucleoside-diphosphate-sugar epimerase
LCDLLCIERFGKTPTGASLGIKAVYGSCVSSARTNAPSGSTGNIGFFAGTPSIIVNAAAWTDVDEAESNFEGALAVNALGVQNLVLAAKSMNAIFVQISTDYVF